MPATIRFSARNTHTAAGLFYQACTCLWHGVAHKLERGILIDCYHCSRYNTQIKHLTTPMFEKVFKRAQTLLK